MVFNMTEEEWQAVIDVHLKGTFNTCRHAVGPLPRAAQRPHHQLVVASAFGAPGQPNYGAAKAGIIGLTLVCAERTGALQRDRQRDPAERRDADDRLDPARARGGRADRQVPSELAMGTERDPDNVAPLVAYLASDAGAVGQRPRLRLVRLRLRLMSQPKIIKTLRGRPPLDGRGTGAVRAAGLRPDLEPPTVDSCSRAAAARHGEWQWVEARAGLRFWGTKLEPYGELVW